MSLFFKGPEQRSFAELEAWARGEDGVSPGVRSMEDALRLVPVLAAVSMISTDVSTLPLQSYRRNPSGSRFRIATPAWLGSPTEGLTRVDWVGQAMTSLLLRGNAYGLKTSWTAGLPTQVTWLHPDRVHVDESAPRLRYFYDGRPIETPNMMHVRGMLLPGSRVGVSPIKAAAAMMNNGAEAQAFAREWFRNKARPSTLFRNNNKTLDPEVADKVAERLFAKMRTGRPFVTGSDWEMTSLTLTAEDAGFIMQSKATATQVAAIYGVQAERIGGETGSSLTYSTEELNAIRYVSQTLRPWMVRLETAFSRDLYSAEEYGLFNPDALMRTDAKTRREIYKTDREIGLRNIDELRELEDERPLPDGKGQDYTPLSKMTAPTREDRA